MDNVVSGEVRRLLAAGISSVDHVDVLFHLARGESTRAELAATTRFTEALLDVLLDELVGTGLAVRRGDGWAITEDVRNRDAIGELLAIYNARPVTLVRAIYARELLTRTVADRISPRPNT
jgi:hypothetical protein